MSYLHKIIDANTGEETEIEYTAAETKQQKLNEQKALEAQAEAEAKAAAREATVAKLAALGLTPEDLAAL